MHFEVEEELGHGLIQLREKLHQQEVKDIFHKKNDKNHFHFHKLQMIQLMWPRNKIWSKKIKLCRSLQWRKKFNRPRKSLRLWTIQSNVIITSGILFNQIIGRDILFQAFFNVFVETNFASLIWTYFHSETRPCKRGGRQKEDWKWGCRLLQFALLKTILC